MRKQRRSQEGSESRREGRLQESKADYKKGARAERREVRPASRPRTPEPVALTPVVEPKAETEDDWEAKG
jgi:hypothetical protein